MEKGCDEVSERRCGGGSTRGVGGPACGHKRSPRTHLARQVALEVQITFIPEAFAAFEIQISRCISEALTAVAFRFAFTSACPAAPVAFVLTVWLTLTFSSCSTFASLLEWSPPQRVASPSPQPLILTFGCDQAGIWHVWTRS